LFKLLKEGQVDSWAGGVMVRELEWGITYDTLAEAYRKMIDAKKTVVPVVENGFFKGMLSLENIGRYFMIHSIQKEEENAV